MKLIDRVKTMIPVSRELEAALTHMAETISFPKGFTLIASGSRSPELFFVEKGLLRGFYMLDGKEITNWFGAEGEFATCFYSFITQQPSVETLQVLEDSELVRIPFKTLQKLYVDFPETERVGRLLIEDYYVRLDERLLAIQFKSARERYDALFAKRPSLFQRANLGHIASYLGMTQETLSRIRGNS